MSGFKRAKKSHRIHSTDGFRDGVGDQSTRIQAGVVLQDPTGRIVAASEQAARLLGADGPTSLVGRDFLFPDDMAIQADGSAFRSEEQPTAIALASGREHPDTVLGLRQPGAATLWFHVRAEPLMKVGDSIAYMTATRFIPLMVGGSQRDAANSPMLRPARPWSTCTRR